MNRRNFFKLTGTFTGGLLVVPDFLYSFGMQDNLSKSDSCLVFIQLSGGNDGLNTFIPFQDDLYYKLRPNISFAKNSVITAGQGMAFHPSLKGFADILQQGDMTVLQNVGYPEPVLSHFRGQEIWQTASGSGEYLTEGWLGRFLDHHYRDHHPTGAINADSIDNLALRGIEPNSMTLTYRNNPNQKNQDSPARLSDNPQLDFVRKIAGSMSEGSAVVQDALKKAAPSGIAYPKSELGRNMEWIAKLIKGGLNSKVYYTSHTGFDTHQNQLVVHNSKLSLLNDAVYSFYKDIKAAKKLEEVTLVIFSEFGRRVADNGTGTDHGKAAPMFVIGGGNKGKLLGGNPNLSDLDGGDLKYTIDFRSVYASLLKDKFSFNPNLIGIKNQPVTGLF
ncbi:DUF1501 domain-containing protein [uncultured Flavobacterium sp.]|uniref:DUF1501 domain-containing protein n=1 Tax=uncultured Flavobacterium sp. TaxID=165435 RepID=UPI0025CE0860|nr:DUF1501 domain-containing protein [uncultured Flavobacterium sp.]